MKEKDLIKALKGFKPLPSEDLQRRFDRALETVEGPVTKSHHSRIHVSDLYKMFSYMYMNTKLIATVSVAALAVLALGGGAAFAANPAIPGDMLFPVDKVAESVRRAFTFGADNKAQFEIAVMDERIEELETQDERGTEESTAASISEIDAQMLRLRERLQEMNQLREENKLQTQEQLQVMQKLQERVQNHEETMNIVQNKLQSSGDTDNSESLLQVKNRYSDDMDEHIQGFEQETGLNLQESEQNQGEDTQIQNQNQVQNEGDPAGTPQNGNGSTQNNQGGTQPRNGQ